MCQKIKNPPNYDKIANYDMINLKYVAFVTAFYYRRIRTCGQYSKRLDPAIFSLLTIGS